MNGKKAKMLRREVAMFLTKNKASRYDLREGVEYEDVEHTRRQRFYQATPLSPKISYETVTQRLAHNSFKALYRKAKGLLNHNSKCGVGRHA
jgi:hypothetical protein